MEFKNLFKNINYTLVSGEDSIIINSVQYDSRKIKQGDAFFAIEGFNLDGHDFIKKAIEKGATVIIVQRDVELLEGITFIKVEDSRKALAIAAANYYGNPSEKMKIIGITGTNGKTTSAFMIKAILEESGYKVGLIGTIANYIGDVEIHTDKTTPESLELQKLFKEMVDKNVDYCVMEVSSHSLDLQRVYGVEFSQSIFTNLTRDHLDFHKTFENYFNAKSKLFKMSRNSIINVDDSYGLKLVEMVGDKATTYSLNNSSNLQGYNLNLHSRGIEFTLDHKGDKVEIKLSIPGKYNVYNALGCIGATLNEGVDIYKIKTALEKVTVPGRCEIVTLNNHLGFDIIVDYSHTPDSLENILNNVREFTQGNLICVFGCGGDRDRTKRPIMGNIGSNLSDFAIITSDNPRTENPYEILKEIVVGVETDNYELIESRRDAIKRAISMAQKGDIVVIAGKGHETYQILKDKTIDFDERKIVAEIIKELGL
ncbi:UDP-N-acetylmuramoyl-L-alanyl-D-glutamate--2,6-diaminopimelate ligase [Clostridium sp.]|uniref:UDP-N-acetylmuramoyl-L-alanyl-D-glutamate--2, 6-diaminopimelate ligase n=1 Tax=Clostridium sp. TaxID=1506 RepID=UPI002FC651EF